MVTMFPRMKIRGPIEAILKPILSQLSLTFPRMKIRGPIEAKTIPISISKKNAMFPRMKIRGPIEAFSFIQNLNPGFH